MSEQEEAASTAAGLRLAEEIRLLVELVMERAAPWLDGVLADGHGREEESGQAKTGGSACGWCPLCAIVAIVRGERPELVARLLDQLAQLVALLRAVLADRWEPEDGVHLPGFRPVPRAPAEPVGTRSSPRVQHIAVRRRDREN